MTNKESIIMDGKIFCFERISKIESKISIEFVIPREWESEFLEKFQEDEMITFQKPNLDI